MVASYRTARGGWWGVLGLVVLLTLILAGGGIALALRQGRVDRQARVRGLRDRAEIVSNQLQRRLRDLTEDRIGQIYRAYASQDDPTISHLVSREVWIELAFTYDRWALITWPATTVARSDRWHEAFAPPGFGLAEQLEFVDRKLDEAIALYHRCTGEGTPLYWQLQARMAIAGCLHKQQRFDEAIKSYQRLRTRYSMVLRGLDSPSLFSVNLALIDVLRDAKRTGQAAAAAEELLQQALDGQVPLPAREYAEMLTHRLETLTARSPEEIQQAQRQLGDIATRQHRLAGAASVVQTWMGPRLDPPLGTEERGVQFVTDTLGVRPRALAYRRFESGGTETLVGLCIHLPALYESFVVPTVEAASRGDLTVGPSNPEGPEVDAPWTQSLAMPLYAWRLRPAAAFVDRVGHDVRRQTWVTISLTSAALAVLMAAMVVLVLAVRREAALTRLKNEFVANVSHELKTPLALIRLFGETLLHGRTPSEEKRQEYYAVITRESERLTHLINNILDFSRIDAGHKRYQRTTCDVGQIVGQTLEAYRFQLDHHGFDLRVKIASDLPAVAADADAIARAVLNLVNNAVKYSQDRKVVEVRVTPGRRAGRDGVTIAVADQGVGISPAERDHLFDSFYRGSGELVRTRRGSGLGLTLVSHIVAGHDGEVWVDSEPGAGSTFTIFLPEIDHQAGEETSCHES